MQRRARRLVDIRHIFICPAGAFNPWFYPRARGLYFKHGGAGHPGAAAIGPPEGPVICAAPPYTAAGYAGAFVLLSGAGQAAAWWPGHGTESGLAR